MKKLAVLLLMVMIIGSFELKPQDFDYRLEEAPAVSWNGVPLFDARMMALGGISLLASPPFAPAINPALISPDRKFRLGVGFHKLKHEAFQYWGVNQGVIPHEKPFAANHANFSALAGTLALKGIRFTAGWFLSNLPQFPSFKFETEYQYSQKYYYEGLFSGSENTYFAAAALTWGKTLDIGIKLDYIRGNREVTITDFDYTYFYDDIQDAYLPGTIILKQRENHKYNRLVPTLGARLRLSSRWTVAAALVYPLPATVKRNLTRTWQNIRDNINIVIRQQSEDTQYTPAKIILGAAWEIPLNRNSHSSKRLIMAAESKYIFWSGYRYIFFSEEIPRHMKNTLVPGFGLEYGSYSSKGDFFLRLGFSLDPQPLKTPDTTLKVLTGGFGVRFGFLSGDFGLAYYYGAPGGAKQDHLVFNSTLRIRF